jgi:hypothetical protein
MSTIKDGDEARLASGKEEDTTKGQTGRMPLSN